MRERKEAAAAGEEEEKEERRKKRRRKEEEEGEVARWPRPAGLGRGLAAAAGGDGQVGILPLLGRAKRGRDGYGF